VKPLALGAKPARRYFAVQCLACRSRFGEVRASRGLYMRFVLRDCIDDLDLDRLLGFSTAIPEGTSDCCGIERDYSISS